MKRTRRTSRHLPCALNPRLLALLLRADARFAGKAPGGTGLDKKGEDEEHRNSCIYLTGYTHGNRVGNVPRRVLLRCADARGLRVNPWVDPRNLR